MIRNKRYEIVKSLRSSASTFGRLYFIFFVAAILLAGWDQEARGQKESTPNAIQPASETVDGAHKEPVLATESAPRPQSDSAPIIPSPEVKKWIERFEELSHAIQIGQLDQEFADLFYKELNAALTGMRNRLRDALTALDKPAKASSAKGAKRSSGSNTEPEKSKGASPPDRATEDRERAFLDTKQLREDLNVLYQLRIQTLELVSPELRDRITGTGFEGVQAFKEELDYLSLRFRYRIKLLPQIGKQAAGKMKGAPIPAVFTLIQIVITILIFMWWRRWTAQGITRVRRSILDIRPLKPHHKRMAKYLWYLNRVRSPIEWFILLVLISKFISAHKGIFYILLWTQVKYILFAWFTVTLIDALSARGAAGLKSETAGLRLRSIWLVVVWILSVGMGMNITEDMAGKGVIHAWFWTFSKVLTLPVVFLLIRWWRPEIYSKLERESQRPAYIKKILRNKQGPGSYLGAAIGAAYLIGDVFRQWFLRGIATFEWGRHLIANLTRIEAVRVSERQRRQHHGDPIPEEMRKRLFMGEGILVESVGRNILERMVSLVEQERQGTAVIVAERGGGKTQLLERLDRGLDKMMLLFDCPPGGLKAVRQALAEALDLKVSDLSPEVMTRRLRDRRVSVIGIDNIHRLCRPALGGQREIDQLAELMKALKVEVFWFLGMDWAAWQYISRVRADRLFFDDVLKLALWKQNQISELIEQRSARAGIQPDFGKLTLPRQFEDMDYETVEERNRFGFHRILWNASDGNPAVALQLWADSLRVTSEGRIIVSLPQLPATEELESVNTSVLLMLRVIAQSGYANQEEITDSLKLPETEVASALRFALAREWVESADGSYRLTWKWFRSITRVLARQNLLVRRTIGG
jgi:AAA domain